MVSINTDLVSVGARGRGERFRAGKHFLAQILILRVLGVCLQWLEAFEYSVGAICRLVGPQVDTVLWGKMLLPTKDVNILYCQSGHYLENKTETLRNSFRYRHRPRSHVPGELQRFIHCYDAVWQLLNPKLQRRNGG